MSGASDSESTRSMAVVDEQREPTVSGASERSEGRGYRRCGWSTTPDVVRAAARDRARRCIGEDDPKLTVLEKAYWRLERGESLARDQVGNEIDNGWESWGS